MRRHRQAQGMSAQRLADRCAQLGMPTLQRTVIANLESGRRDTVTLAEVLVLAEALGVAPAALVFPVGYAETVEHLPGQEAEPLAALDWFNGSDRDEGSALALLREHRSLEQRIRGHYRRIWDTAIGEGRWHGEPDGPEAQAAREVAAELTTHLHELRAEIASRGLTLPPLAGLEPNEGDRPTV
ncbi:helix-turn-helix domain-containing protein [Streptomyces sp. NPDC057456]|uniref:helix-turn-helix domain-containing protein n=1 Tax=Streptomyces sp. NPDC057456 TaxID=3346139 RepID=UPI0036AC5252